MANFRMLEPTVVALEIFNEQRGEWGTLQERRFAEGNKSGARAEMEKQRNAWSALSEYRNRQFRVVEY